MKKLRAFIHSPLARCPSLLGHKLASRLGLDWDRVSVSAPPQLDLRYPPEWAPALRTWLKDVPLAPPPHAFNRVFELDFDEDLLLKMCREGPRQGATGLTSDIKLAWDYSRGQPLFTNAAGEGGSPERCAAFLRRWLEANTDLNGPTWTCAMETAIRGVNWAFADVLFGGELGRRFGSKEWAAWLWRQGAVVWQRLEARLISSNHYLADLLGLYVLGTIFPGNAQARTWRQFAQSEFVAELLSKTHPDGCLNEASLRYHAYVTEMALLFRLAQARPLPETAENRLQRMCQIAADFRDANGDVFALGDDDSGRVLAVDFVSEMGRADVLLRLANLLLERTFESSASAVYRQGGWWMTRAGDFAVALDFGGVGLHGGGGHAHNDDFSFCLEWRGKSLITDPGTYLYTGDPAARNQFRSTWYHNTLIVDEQEQRPLGDDVFILRGPDKAFRAEAVGEDGWIFERRLAPSMVHRRQVKVRPDMLVVRDMLEGAGRHKLDWRFHLQPGVRVCVAGRAFALSLPQIGTLLLEPAALPEQEAGDCSLTVLPTEYSPGYGRRQPTSACAASIQANLPFALEWKLKPAMP